MNHVSRAVATAALLLLALAAGCASAPRAIQFGPDSATGLLVVTMPKTAYVHSADFRGVDLGNNRFRDGVTTLDAADWSGDAINSEGELYLAVKELEAGDYVLQGLFTSRGSAQFGGCAADGGPVYSVKPGKITLVRADNFWRMFLAEGFVPDVDDQAVLRVFEAARATGAHDIRGAVAIGEPSALVRWPSPTSWTRDCVRAETFTLLD